MIREKIDEMIKDAMKAGNQTDLTVFRSIKNAFMMFECERAGNVVTDDVELKLIGKLVASHKDSIRQYMDACRDDLVEIEQAELEVLQRFMPKDPTQAEVELEVNKFIADFISLSGVSPTMKNMRDCMSYVHKTYPTANGGVISNIFKNKI